ncbi:DNA-directed RNA polymerase [Elasticomyces elasticus]|nr:DNA-directed RNA polymerase [Elasticomyces elasticus]
MECFSSGGGVGNQIVSAKPSIEAARHPGYKPPPYSVPSGGLRKQSPHEHTAPSYAALTSANLRHFDPLVIDTTLETAESAYRQTSKGTPGNPTDLLQHLYTCLRVNRFKRAEALIQRLLTLRPFNSSEVIHAHGLYLEESLRALSTFQHDQERSQNILHDMQTWFEVQIRAKSVPADERVFNSMVRACIMVMTGNQRDRALKRYVHLARVLTGIDLCEEASRSEEYDDDEYAILVRAVDSRVAVDTQEELSGDATRSAESVTAQLSGKVQTENSEYPGVRPTEQKGLGLEALKLSLAAFDDFDYTAADPATSPEAAAYARQKDIEETATFAAMERWRQEDEQLRSKGIQSAMQTRSMGALMWQWQLKLVPVLQRELEEVRQALEHPSQTKSTDQVDYGAHLETVALEKVAAITILTVMYVMTNRRRKGHNKDTVTGRIHGEVTLSFVADLLGKSVEQESNAEAKKQLKRAAKAHTRRIRRAGVSLDSSPDQSEHGPATSTTPDSIPTQRVNERTQQWPASVKMRLGVMLVTKLAEIAEIAITRTDPRTKKLVTQMQPAFYHKIAYFDGRKRGCLATNPDLVRKLRQEPVPSLVAKRLPMVVEPKPWTNVHEGAYLSEPSSLVRFPVTSDKSSRDYVKAAANRHDLDHIYAGLNVLGKTAWKINHDVFKVQLEAWNSGEEIANFPPADPKLEYPPKPPESSGLNSKYRWLKEMQEVDNIKGGYHSVRCFQNFQLEIARAYKDEKLYFPHNLDFRGRAYPIPPYLNHMGADNCRGLLVFAEGRELGTSGLRWLKIHVANVFGYDKASLTEREEFTMEHLSDIYDSATNPLDGRKWWLEAEDRWQTLAACFELKNALDSPDPTKFISHIPVHQDGTCNGLQHYAALGGDAIGAKQVNLEPGDRPSDIYTAVADAVNVEVEKDCAMGNEIALALRGKIVRKLVKRPVMTNVYGVTYHGAKVQVQDILEELLPELRHGVVVNHISLSVYITTKIFKCLGNMFTGAQAIQHWLGACADRICAAITPEQISQIAQALARNDPKSVSETPKIPKERPVSASTAAKRAGKEGRTIVKRNGAGLAADITVMSRLFKSSVIWTTPLRLPVVQPYRTSKAKTITTNLQRMSLQEPQVWDPVSRRKQLQAFPPNFIHSLDATHMLLSALKCSEHGLTFASIHDCFWTHACDIDEMSVILRDAFVEMHSDNIIGRLREEFQVRYKGCMYLAPVHSQSPLGRNIMKNCPGAYLGSKGNKSKSKTDGLLREMLREVERQRLINSENEEDREKGKAMVTPGSIYLDAMGTDAFEVPVEIADSMLGKIPESQLAAKADAVEDDTQTADIVTEEDMSSDEVEYQMRTVEDADAEADSENTDADDDMNALAPPTRRRKKQAPQKPKIFVWLPMTFPEIPKRGEFDVNRLKKSQYFFH